jgi:fructose-bisphosphate aldolase class II
MYTTMKYILDDATQNNYAVIAANAINMEMARGEILAADELEAPLIIIIGPMAMMKHASADLMVPIIKTLAETTKSPIALCLDHGRKFEDVAYAFRMGFSSIMIDASTYEMEENIQRTQKVVELCRAAGVSVEGELGHVGMAATLDGCNEAMYTRPEDAVQFATQTHVDSLAIAAGTAHGKYPDGFIPKINFELIRKIKAATNHMPLALHGSSGSGDENIRKAVEAGINKINVATEILMACKDSIVKRTSTDPDIAFLDLLVEMQQAAKDMTSHWIQLSGSAGKSKNFRG